MKKYIYLILLLGQFFALNAVSFNWFSQNDPRWGGERLGSRGNTSIRKSGCVLTSLSMLLNAEASNPLTTPDKLNLWLKQNGGYAGSNMRWQMPGLMDGTGWGLELVSQNNSRDNWDFLSEQLSLGNKVIVKVAGRRSHWVLVVKQDGPKNHPSSYIVNDPGIKTYEPRTLAFWGGFRASRAFSGNWIDEKTFTLQSDISVVPVDNDEFFLYDLYQIAHPADVFVSIKNNLPVDIKGFFILTVFSADGSLVETVDYDYQTISADGSADIIYEIEDSSSLLTDGAQIKILFSKYYSDSPSLMDTFDITKLSQVKSTVQMNDVTQDIDLN
ncbi:MAG: hypothetical protein CVU48_05740 [Candidatus Cloacimonetes bacterium HGW-Cloacimonetes-1]|jgi:hypothetical protein|nr:MAG: hypothetical protein CVU48_05740 [Candidatus Cloacimonetes bacterium HGW-Cloacimonetes-1]